MTTNAKMSSIFFFFLIIIQASSPATGDPEVVTLSGRAVEEDESSVRELPVERVEARDGQQGHGAGAGRGSTTVPRTGPSCDDVQVSGSWLTQPRISGELLNSTLDNSLRLVPLP